MATLRPAEAPSQEPQLEQPSQQILEEDISRPSQEDLEERLGDEDDDFDSDDFDLYDLDEQDDLENELNDHDSWDNATGGTSAKCSDLTFRCYHSPDRP
jgi:hypothetical protein